MNERVNVGTRVCLHSKVADLNQIHADFQPMNQRNIVTEETFPCKKILKLLRKTFVFYFNLFLSFEKNILAIQLMITSIRTLLSHIFALLLPI